MTLEIINAYLRGKWESPRSIFLFLPHYLIKKKFYCCSNTVISTFRHPLPPLTFSPPPTLALAVGPLYMFLDNPLPSFPYYLPSGYCQFFILMSLVIFCFLVCFVHWVPLTGEIIWYLSFTAWLISRSIMLSRSVHAVIKSRSSFFFLLHSSPLCKCTIVFFITF